MKVKYRLIIGYLLLLGGVFGNVMILNAAGTDSLLDEQMDLIQTGSTTIPSEEYNFVEDNYDTMKTYLEGEVLTLEEKQAAAQLARANDNETLETRKMACATVLYEGMINIETKIDVAQFALTRTEFREVISNVTNSNPELFYIRNGYKISAFALSQSDSTEIVEFCTGFYEEQTEDNVPNTEKIEEKREKLKSKRDLILKDIIVSGMSDMQKALAVHEYIVLNTQYDFAAYIQYEQDGLDSNFQDSDFDVYGTLMNGLAVCQGYALSYKYLLEAAGVENIGFASNDTHIWNTVTLASQNYYVDCTWDDPNWDTLGNVKHSNFLKSEAGFDSHTINDTDRECNSSQYDTMFWTNVDSNICYYKGAYYYINDNGILERTLLNNASGTDNTKENVKDLSLETSNSWNYNNAAKIALIGDYIIYHNQKEIFSYNLKKDEIECLFEPQLEENELIYGLQYKDGKIAYSTRNQLLIGDDVSYQNLEQTIKTVDVPASLYGIPVQSIEIKGDDSVILYEDEDNKLVSKSIKLSATVLPENASEKRIKKWTSSDTSVAVVDIYGKVKGLKPGQVIISAYSYDETVVGKKTISVIYEGPVKNSDGNTLYYEQGKLMTNQFYTVNDKTYYLGPDGVRVTGWQTINGKQYYFNPDGLYQTGWQTVEGNTYYFDGNGIMLTNWQTLGGQSYYFDAQGVLQKNWKNIDGNMYYFNDGGALHKGWLTQENARYYFNENGIMLTGWQTINGKRYYFSDKGVMATGFKTIKKKKYYFGSKGVMATGFKTIKKKKYYFGKKGVMATGWKTIKKKKYYFSGKGVMATGWKTIKKKRYYFNKKGVMQKGLTSIKGISYYFARDGHLIS